MAIPQLTPEQIRSMSLEEKDAWWLQNVYRGDMPQLTWRAAVTGMVLGGLLSLTNLYIGARTGWILGVGITSVILSFGMFKVLSRVGLGHEMTLLENNAMQSIATSAGYTNAALTSSLAAYSMVTGRIVPMYQVFVWLVVIAVLGVLFAFPMKKRFINDEQLPFPDGRAAGVLMDALHDDQTDGLFKAKLLAVAAAVAAFIEVIRDDMLMRVLFAARALPSHWDDLLYGDGDLARWLARRGLTPRFHGIELRELSVQLDSSIILLATGGLMGIEGGVSMLVGGVLNYFVLAPWMIARGVIVPDALGHYGYGQIVVWSLWGSVAAMTTSSLYAFFSRPQAMVEAFRAIFRRRGPARVDVLAHIELPLRLSFVGVPVAAAVLVVLGHLWFGIQPWLGVIAVPLVFVTALVAVSATALTGITPTGPLAKLTQLAFGVLAPRNIIANVMSAGITAEVSNNAANLLMDIKPGYMLGAKPRQQAVGHLLGAVAGLAFSVPVWYLVFIQGDLTRYGTERLPVPAAVPWKAVAELLMTGLDNLDPTARVAVVVGGVLGIAIEVVRQVSKNRFPLAAMGMALALVLPFQDVWTLFVGSVVFWALQRRTARFRAAQAPEAPAPRPWFTIAADNTDTICAGVVAGGALMGIALKVLDVLVFPEVKEAHALAPLVQHAAAALAR